MSTSIPTYKYLDVYNAIRSDILLKIYPANSLLPTESALMEKYGVSRNTIRKAIKILQDNGFVSTKQGSGSTIRSDILDDPAPGSYPPWQSHAGAVEYRTKFDTISVSRGALDKISAPAEVADAFNISVGTEIYQIQRIWKMDGVPFTYMVQYINREILPGFSQHLDEDRKIERLISKYWGLHAINVEEHISCINANFIEAGLLNVEVGTALMHTVRIAYCDKGAYEYAIFYGNPKYTGYIMRIK